AGRKSSARWISLTIGSLGIMLMVWEGVKRRVSKLEGATQNASEKKSTLRTKCTLKRAFVRNYTFNHKLTV
ncbi:hypothetical protein ACUOBA_15555, partial [Escherichia coli]